MNRHLTVLLRPPLAGPLPSCRRFPIASRTWRMYCSWLQAVAQNRAPQPCNSRSGGPSMGTVWPYLPRMGKQSAAFEQTPAGAWRASVPTTTYQVPEKAIYS
jgi:hypothetical protein